jgi:large subunit ribosomal protein L30
MAKDATDKHLTEKQAPDKQATGDPATTNPGGTFRIKWVRSFIGCTRDMRQTIRGLGFRRMQQVVECADTPSVRGMVHKVRHLVVQVD